MNILMLDLAAEYRELEAELMAAIREVLAAGNFILGPQVAALEREVAEYIGVPHAVAVASGTDALHLVLRAAGVGADDEVVVPAFTFIATAEAVSHAGARPVFADIDPATYNLDPASLEAAITPRTRAVIVVHLYGHTANLELISAICARRGLAMIEDCAQAFGADFAGKSAGAWGEAGCFSFYPTKNLGAYGDGGMVTTGDPVLADRIRMLRHHGSRTAGQHETVGYNSRLDELQAAILRVKLRHVTRWNERRRGHAAAYRRLLAGGPFALPAEHGRGAHVYHQFTIRSAARDAVRKRLAAQGVASAVYYALPLYRQPAYASVRRSVSCPAAEQAAREVLSLPIYPQLTEEAIHHVCNALLSAVPATRA